MKIELITAKSIKKDNEISDLQYFKNSLEVIKFYNFLKSVSISFFFNFRKHFHTLLLK